MDGGRGIGGLSAEKSGVCFQDYNLLDTLNIKQNIMLPLTFCSRKKEEVDVRVKGISDTLGIGDLAVYWSRRIDGANRIVYRIEDNTIRIVQCGSLYRDK